MRLLLDTCTFLWIIADDPHLSEQARSLFQDPENEVFLSVVSAWEITLKHRLGKLPLPTEPRAFIARHRDLHDIQALPLEETAVYHLTSMPEIHRDPFDRMLICQAIEETMCLLTPDPVIHRYPVKVCWE